MNLQKLQHKISTRLYFNEKNYTLFATNIVRNEMKAIKTIDTLSRGANSIDILRSHRNLGGKVRGNQALGLFVPCLHLTINVTPFYVQEKCVGKGANTQN